MQNNGFKIYSINELKNIKHEKIMLIQNYAKIEYKKFMNIRTKTKAVTYQIVNTNSCAKNVLKKRRIQTNKTSPYATLETTALYKTTTSSFPFQEENEKMLFICSTIFPNNEALLNSLFNNNMLEILNELIETYNYFDERYNKNPQLNRLQKNVYFQKFVKQYNYELQELCNYFFEFYRISNLNLIINKLFQIYYLDKELYDEYITNSINDNKSLTKQYIK